MSQLCVGCKIGFVKGHKGYSRVKLLNIVSPDTAKAVFPGLTSPQNNHFICHNCRKYLNEKTRVKVKNKPQRTLITPTNSPESKKRKEMLTPSPAHTDAKKQAVSVEPSDTPGASTSTHAMSVESASTFPHSPGQIVVSVPPSPTSSTSSQSSKKSTSKSPTSPSQSPSKTTTSPGATPRISRGRRPARSLGDTPLSRAKYYVENSQYFDAFRMFLKSTAKQHLIRACTDVIKKEKRALVQDENGPLRKELDLEEMASFSWDGVLDWASGKAPFLMACLKGMFPNIVDASGKQSGRGVGFVAKRHSKKRPLSKAQRTRELKLQETLRETGLRNSKIKQRTGMALAISVFTSSQKVNFVQKCLGIELWKQGCPQKIVKTMNSMGLSLGVDSTRSAIDKMRLGHGEKFKEWKEKAEKRTPGSKDSPSYSVTWDSVQMSVQGKPQSKGHANKGALTFAHQNKVNSSKLQGTGCQAIDVPPEKILPTTEDFQRRRQRMVIIVMRILVDNLSALSTIHQNIVQHIPHQHTKAMNTKSNLVNLGVVSADPSSNAGVIEIMRKLNDYVPVVDGEPIPILCGGGDGLIVERMINCKQTIITEETAFQRCDGLIPAPQEYHREMLLLQDSMDLLYTSESERARGTIAQLEDHFAHRSLKKSANDMMEFATSAYVTLLATTFCGMATVDDVPESLPNRKADKLAWLESLASRIVEYAWVPEDQAQIDLVASSAALPVDVFSEKDLFLFCHCKKDKKEPMVQCCSRLCEVRWLHISCAGLTEVPEKEEDFFCSAACTADGTYMYCICSQRRGGQMIQCQMAEHCKKKEWYHTGCLTPADGVLDEDGTWYCSAECKSYGSLEDFVQNYSKALMWEGLNHMARRDAVREGDGPAMVSSWKMDLLQFWRKNHTHYFVIGHHMLTGIGGYLPENLRSDLTWNRVANLSGKPGANVGLDLVNESLKKDFKEMMTRSHGKFTDKEIQRCAEMGGAFGQDLDRILTGAGDLLTSDDSSFSHRDGQKRRLIEDIKEFVKEYQSDNLFRKVPGRCHEGLSRFRYDNKLKEPIKMGKKMRMLAQYRDNFDLWTGLPDVNL